MYPYRVFISYSHEDRELVEELIEVLEGLKLCPMWDKNFAFGSGFHDQIKLFIAHAHIFMPVITKSSSRRGWVHQEIGYAMAYNIPVLPLAKGVLPGEMIQGLQAVQFNESIDEIKNLLAGETFTNLVNQYIDPKFALYQCGDLTEDRAMMMAAYAERVLALRAYGSVRQKGALSSFHIPDKIITDPIWKKRYGQINRDPFHCRVQRGERIALEKHARKEGCKLIIDPYISYDIYGVEARLVRLQGLIDFLESMIKENVKVEVVINQGMNVEESVTIVGDWFAAESISSSMGHGYRQTIFTHHAPSMKMKIDLFDQEFEELRKNMKCEAADSAKETIGIIAQLMKDIKKENGLSEELD